MRWKTFTLLYDKFIRENIHQILSESAEFCRRCNKKHSVFLQSTVCNYITNFINSNMVFNLKDKQYSNMTYKHLKAYKYLCQLQHCSANNEQKCHLSNFLRQNRLCLQKIVKATDTEIHRKNH